MRRDKQITVCIGTVGDILERLKEAEIEPTDEVIEESIKWLTANAQSGADNALDDLQFYLWGELGTIKEQNPIVPRSKGAD